MTDAIIEEKIRRARLSGPSIVTADATVADMDAQGHLQVLSKGTNADCPGGLFSIPAAAGNRQKFLEPESHY